MNDERITIVGEVCSGNGKAARHMADEAESFAVDAGEKFVPGSLNLRLRNLQYLDESASHSKSEMRLLWPAECRGKPVWLYRYRHAPLHSIEVLSTVHLRTEFNLSDGDALSIAVPSHFVLGLSLRRRLAWMLVWLGRENWIYQPEKRKYYELLRQLSIDLGATQAPVEQSVLRALTRPFNTLFRKLVSIGRGS